LLLLFLYFLYIDEEKARHFKSVVVRNQHRTEILIDRFTRNVLPLSGRIYGHVIVTAMMHLQDLDLAIKVFDEAYRLGPISPLFFSIYSFDVWWRVLILASMGLTSKRLALTNRLGRLF